MLAVDPGTVRVGLALSDEGRVLASPLRTLPAQPAATLAGRLAAVTAEVGATQVVVGLPRRLDGGQGPEARAARALAEEIAAATGLRVELYDERLSSVQAERALVAGGVRRARRRDVVDQVAATLILQSYLDRRRG